METYCVRCKKKTEKFLNSKVFKTKYGGMIMLLKCVKCGFIKSRFLK